MNKHISGGIIALLFSLTTLVSNSQQSIYNEELQSLKFYRFDRESGISDLSAANWLKANLLKTEEGIDFRLFRTQYDQIGYKHQKFQQYYHGIQVEHGVYIVHSKAGKIVSANGEYYSGVTKLGNELPQITLASAEAVAKKQFKGNEIENLNKQTSALRYYYFEGNYYLCYRFELRCFEPLQHQVIYVNARNGKVLQAISKLHDVDVPGTTTTQFSGTKTITCNSVGTNYNLTTSGRNLYTRNCGNGTSMASATEFVNASTTWTYSTAYDRSAMDLHFGLEKTYDYYSTKFSRTSYDNAGALVRGIAHYSSGYNNAFWSSPYMVFGDGDGFTYNAFTPIDVVGHEFTHAVTENEAGLIYMNQSGALNESFSDIFGVCVDFYANPSTANFLEGEQVSVSNVPFRNMTNPNATSQPDTYNGTFWVPTNGPDNGGVHTNSQVQNFWFYLLCQGGSGTNDIFNAYSVSGIGITQAEAIAYRNLSVYLTSNSTFADARTYAIQSAIDLYGNCSNQVIQTTNAWYAVGVGSTYTAGVVAQFSANPTFSCSLPANVAFTNQSVNGSNYQWNFGDGSAISTATNPVHSYTAAGSYNVKLKTFGTTACGSVDSIIKTGYVTISSAGAPSLACVPVQGFNTNSYGITNVQIGTINNTSPGDIEGYKDFCCSNQTTLVAGNPYLLTVTKVNSYGYLSVWIDYNNDGVLNQTNELVAAYTPTSSIYTHTFLINTPSSAVTGVPLRMRVYDDYNAILSSCQAHSQGQTEDYALFFTTNTTAPIANFFTTTRTVQVGTNVLFQDSSLNVPTTWQWNFQGAAIGSSTLQNPSALYSSVGTYSVRLKVTNAFGADSIVKMAYINVVNNYNMCAPTVSTSAQVGNLFDSGGPGGNYYDYENCSFLIDPGCTGTIAISFSSFQTESCCDFVTVHNGSTTSSPVLGTYSGYSIPPTLYANSGKMLVRFNSDYSVVGTGFSATWTSTLSGTGTPTANFSASNYNPPLATSIQFSDLTTNAPYAWLWQFGDGTFSSQQNPAKSYTTSGVKSITLTATNCSASNTVVNTVTVQSAPIASIAPSPLTGTVLCGDSLVLPFNLQNLGGGQLNFSTTMKSNFDSTRVVICTYGVDMTSGGDYQKIITAINSGYTQYSVRTYTGNTASGLASALLDADVVLFPRQTTLTDTHYSTYSTTLNNFANAGGTVLFTGSSTGIGIYRPFNTGMFTGTIWNWSSGYTASVVAANDSLVYGIGSTALTAPNSTSYYALSNTNKVSVVTYSGYDVVSYRPIGSGRAIIIGADYFNTNSSFNYILSRAISKSRKISLGYTSPSSGTLAASATLSMQAVVKTTGVPGGVYTNTISFYTNQSAPTVINVPVNYTVIGSVNPSLSANCKNFGTIMQYTNSKDSVVVSNSGCSPLIVSSVSNSLSAYTCTPSGSFTVPAWSSQKLYIKFLPTTPGSFNDTIRLNSNSGQLKICAQGTAFIAPTVSVSPGAFSVAVASCNASQTIALTVANSGGSLLTYTAGSATPSVQVLAITNYVDMTQEFPNTIASINTFFTNYALTTHSLSSISAFSAALVGKHVLLIPEQETYAFGFMQSYSTTINNFVSNGGTAIICGSGYSNQINDIGLFTANQLYVSAPTVQVVDTNDAVMRFVPMTTFASPQVTYYANFINSGITHFAKYGSYAVVSKRNIGSGRAIYLGFDFTGFNTNASRIIANAVESSVVLPQWINAPVTSGSVVPSQTATLVYTLSANGLTPGTYTTSINVVTNDPLNSNISVPVTFSVSGSASASLSPTCLNFGSRMQYTSKVDSVTLFNTGCATLSLTASSNTNVAFTFSPSGSFTLAPWSSRKIYVTFTPSLTGNFADSLLLTTNVGTLAACLTGSAYAAPIATVTPVPLTALTTSCNGTQTANLQISNSGGSPLTFTLQGSSITGSVQVLALMNTVDYYTEYLNTIAAINQYNTNYQLTQHTLTSVSSLQTALVGKQVLLIPEMETYYAGLLTTYSNVIVNFVSNGGTAVICGNNSIVLNESGLFTSNFNGASSGNILSVVDTNDVVMNYVGLASFSGPNATVHHTFANSGIVDHVKYGSYSVVSRRNIGTGRAIYAGFDYFLYNNQAARIIANAIRGSFTMPQWLSTTTNTGTVNTSSVQNITYTFNSTGLMPGTYTYNIVVNTNSPLTPTLLVPVSYTVQGTAQASITPGCLSFGVKNQYSSTLDSVMITNTGCANLTATSLSVSNAAFTYTPASSFSLAPAASRYLYVQFSPTLTGTYIDTLRLNTSIGVLKVCLSGTVVPAPSISVSPNPLIVNSTACTGNQTVAITVYNTGGNTLTVGTAGAGSSGGMRQVLAITNYVDMATGGEYFNTVSAISQYLTSYSITQHVLSSVSSFSAALVGKQVLLIPEQETYLSGFMQTYSTTILNFVNAGGTAILCGSQSSQQVNDIGLFNTSYLSWGPSSVTVIDTSDYLMRSLPMTSIVAPNATFYHTFTNSGITNYVVNSIYSVVSKRTIGLGKAYYIGFDYFIYTNQTARMIANAIASTNPLPAWISVPSSTYAIASGSSAVLVSTLTVTGLTPGTYTTQLLFTTNDPLAPTYVLPVTYSVNYLPTTSLSANCINFGSLLQNTAATDSVRLYNTGCGVLSVSNMTLGAPFSFSPAPVFTIAPGNYRTIAVTFSPTVPGNYSDTLTLYTNVGIRKVCVNGSALGYAVMNLSPASPSLALAACGNTQSLVVTVSNTGGTPLNFAMVTPSQTWITISSALSGSILPGNSQTLALNISTGTMSTGTYTSGLVFQSSSPGVASQTLPVSFFVGNNPCTFFSFINPNNCSGLVNFNQQVINSVTSYAWNFGDGGTSTLPNPVHTYTAPGVYTATLTACNGSLCSSYTQSLSISSTGGPITALCSPSAALTSSSYGIYSVKFNTILNNSSTSAVEGSYVDNSCYFQTTLMSGSSYTLRVSTSPSGNEHVKAWIDYDNDGAFSPGELVFTSTNGLVSHSTIVVPPASAVMNTPLRMRVMDENASFSINSACGPMVTGQAEDYAVVILNGSLPPVVSFSTQGSPCSGTITFTDMSTYNPNTWLWNFGDGGVASSQNPVHTYTAPGVYTVTLLGTNAFGSGIATQTVAVNFTQTQIIAPLVATTNQTLAFSSTAAQNAIVNWSFGDGGLSGLQSPVYTYTAAGNYTVTLTVITGTCVNTISTVIKVSDFVDETALEELNNSYQIFVSPNPFSKHTKVWLSLAAESNLKIDLISTLGQDLMTLCNGTMSAGNHSFVLSDIAAGVYYLRVFNGKHYQTFKLVATYE